MSDEKQTIPPRNDDYSGISTEKVIIKNFLVLLKKLLGVRVNNETNDAVGRLASEILEVMEEEGLGNSIPALLVCIGTLVGRATSMSLQEKLDRVEKSLLDVMGMIKSTHILAEQGTTLRECYKMESGKDE